MKKNNFLIIILIFSIHTTFAQQKTSINEAIKERFYDMLKSENVLLDDVEVTRLKKQCDANANSDRYKSLAKKISEKGYINLKKKDRDEYDTLNKSCKALGDNDKKKITLTKLFPKPVPDGQLYSPKTDSISKISIDLLGSMIVTKTKLDEIQLGTSRHLNSWLYSSKVVVQNPKDYNSFSYSYTSEKLLMSSLESDIKVGLPFLQSSLSNNFSFSNQNATSYSIIGGHFFNNLIPVFNDCINGAIGDYNRALPLLELWNLYSLNKDFREGYVLDDFDAIFINKSLSNSNIMSSENSLAGSSGFGYGVFSYNGKGSLDFNSKSSSEYKMTAFDIILTSTPRYVKLPTPENIQIAWNSWGKKQIQPQSILPFNNDSINLIFGPILEDNINSILLDTAYTKSKMNPQYTSLIQLLNIGNPKPIPSKPGFYYVPLMITPNSTTSSQIVIQHPGLTTIALPIKLKTQNTIGALELFREYPSEITLSLNSDNFPTFTNSNLFETTIHNGKKANYSQKFTCDDKNQNRPSSITIKAINSIPKNTDLESAINFKNAQIQKSANNDFTMSFDIDTSNIKSSTVVTCQFSLNLNNSTKTLTTIIVVQPYSDVILIPISDPKTDPASALSKLNSGAKLDGALIQSMNADTAVKKLKEKGIIYTNAYGNDFIKTTSKKP
jgi:hypothetical protein